MSLLFFDHLLDFGDIHEHIQIIAESSEEKEELWNLIDQIAHHRVMTRILDTLPSEHHTDFLERFHNAPHSSTHIVYLNERTNGEIEKNIAEEVTLLKKEILEDILPQKKHIKKKSKK